MGSWNNFLKAAGLLEKSAAPKIRKWIDEQIAEAEKFLKEYFKSTDYKLTIESVRQFAPLEIFIQKYGKWINFKEKILSEIQTED